MIFSVYGVLISLAILVCLLLIEKRAKIDGKPPTQTWDISLTALLCGLAGARAYHVADLWNYYSANSQLIWQVWHGGLGIWGGIIGALVGTYVYLSLRKAPDKTYWLDLFALYTPLGQAIGRFGNYINQENFGIPTSLPWAIPIDTQNRPSGYENFSTFHPLFAYEAILNLVLFGVLLKIAKVHKLGSRTILGLYLIGYSVIRFFLEFLRIDLWRIGLVNSAQSVCVLFFVLGLFTICKKN